MKYICSICGEEKTEVLEKLSGGALKPDPSDPSGNGGDQVKDGVSTGDPFNAIPYVVAAGAAMLLLNVLIIRKTPG